MEEAIEHLKKNFKTHLEDLKELIRIPSVSFEGFPPAEVRRSAEAVALLLEKRGLRNVKVLEIPGAHPYVYGDWLHAPGKPTLLLYAHHDVQPPGRDELWNSPPFEPTLREGNGGTRLYARGSADDKAGIIVHAAAISAYLETLGELPVNVKVVVEGEEETGSANLPRFLETYRELLDADVLVLTDTDNFDCGVPALTIALRGLVGLEIEVHALNKTIHSGMWGGPVPDPAMALSKLLATLVDQEGRISVPGIREQVRPLSADEEKRLSEIPFDEKRFREQSGMLPSARILREGPSPKVQLWRFPSLTVNAIQASSRKQAGNIITDAAWAKVSIRLVPDMDPEKVLRLLQSHLRNQVPWGLEIKFKVEAANGPWAIEPQGPAFEAAEAAMLKGYGVKPYTIGCGGTIPFVKPFADALGGAPALLIGVEDPYTNAHGENESLLVSDLEKACLSQIHLFKELAERIRVGNP